MTESLPQPPPEVTEILRAGVVIPAHPLALTPGRQIDEAHQKALTRYYLDSGAGGLAVGVHTTEFAIHRPEVGYYQPVLELALQTVRDWTERRVVMVAGVVGETRQAVREAEIAREAGYDLVLISLGALSRLEDRELVQHVRAVAQVLPVMGFYLQPSVGGRILSRAFWRSLAAIPNLAAIKIAPFNRYGTLDVVCAVAEAEREGEVALYTGNDDSILIDLLTRYSVATAGGLKEVSIRGGLLGHWAYWTRRAVEQLERCKTARRSGTIPADLLTLAAQVTESNEAVFDPSHSFDGCIAGILYVLSRTGLLSGVYPLSEDEGLSPGQKERIDAVIQAYPHLTDEDWVRENLDRWLRP